MNGDDAQRSLYDARYEHDSCGVGFVADTGGIAQRRVLDLALEALANLEHRGAVDADGKTGDGAGVLTQVPRKVFERELARLGAPLGASEQLAVGVFFFPPHDNKVNLELRDIAAREVASSGMTLLGWRRVPVEESALGAKAKSTAPLIEHALISTTPAAVRAAGAIGKSLGPAPPDFVERELYLLRRRIEKAAAGVPGFYIASLSCRTIVYKGLMVASQLAAFYRDLNDPAFETALAVFHQRYSTNTFPDWSLAQPFRMVAHNGEINTISGNRSWMSAREADLRSSVWGDRIESAKPVIQAGRSDSCSLDNVAELLVLSGRDPVESMMTLVPEAPGASADSDVEAFYRYTASLTEPWDGPAALAFTNGIIAGAALDRNGLRPARYELTDDGLVVMASEAGVVALDPSSIVEKGRLGPGEIIAVDTESRRLLKNSELKSERARRLPYKELTSCLILNGPPSSEFGATPSLVHPDSDRPGTELAKKLKIFGYTAEDLSRILEPMYSEGKEPAGSMGDDTPLAVLSSRPRPLYHYFKQRFAQVTNPAIDPIRERAVMSLETLLGPRPDLLEGPLPTRRLLRLRSPILANEAIESLRNNESQFLPAATLDAVFDAADEKNLDGAIDLLCDKAGAAVDAGIALLILSDRRADQSLAPIPMLLAVSAVHHRLIRDGKRMRASIVAEAGDAREDHHVACLIGYGASAVNPYLAFEVVADEMIRRGMSTPAALRNYAGALESGLLKIMAKMGIASVSSYCGAQIFEAIGLDPSLVSARFAGTAGRLGGVGTAGIARDVLAFHAQAFEKSDQGLEDAGYYRYRADGEFHANNPSVFRALHRAIKAGTESSFGDFSRAVDSRRPVTVRDLLEFRVGAPVPLNEIEPADSIVRRFCASGMSHGALSREAHETIAIAMNRLGARSNSGEGGEDSARFRPRADGDDPNSRVKQVASARFGVTPHYLISAHELEIKISQGSKPGEGGQLPGHKVTAEIAAIRHSVPGVALISPPPHHDIYSIEDLAQLIYDLKQINPSASVAVKLVASSGVGTIAAGVAKAAADVIHIAGHDGGTGASPLGSIKNAGSPWELGLAEAHQVLQMNGLRDRVRLRTDGGLKTGRDIVIAAMLGADEFGFATAPLVALGCVMARQCHLNTCPVGIATQDRRLRERFAGKPEMVVDFFMSLAEEVRNILAGLGLRRIAEAVGRTDLLAQAQTRVYKGVSLDLGPLLMQPSRGTRLAEPRASNRKHRDGDEANPLPALDERILRDVSRALKTGRRILLSYEIRNTDRTTGARLAGDIARRGGADTLAEGAIDIKFRGSAGQSFGAFLTPGLKLTLIGEANDYVGKGMAGGEIAIRPPDEARFDWSRNVIIGNTVMYGATGGSLFIAGRAGERFCVRNSGGNAVVEGIGDHGCEYMTAGSVVVLGEVGRNFAAGMTGGTAYVLDIDGSFESRCNQELVKLEVVNQRSDELIIRRLVTRHYEVTGSPRAREVFWNWAFFRPLFWKVITEAEVRSHMEAPEIVPALRRDAKERRLAAAE